MSAPDALVAESVPPPPKSFGALPLILLALLLGVGAMVALAVSQGPKNAAPQPSTSAASPLESVVLAMSSSAAEEHPSTLPSLTKTHPVASSKPVTKTDAGTRPITSASTAPTHILPFPSTLPPFPSAIPTDLQLPGFGP